MKKGRNGIAVTAFHQSSSNQTGTASRTDD